MKFRVLFTTMAVGVCGGSFIGQETPGMAPSLARVAQAAKKAGAKNQAPQGPTAVDKSIKLGPDGLRFGMTLDALAKLYERVFEKEFVPLYQKVEPGPRMVELDAELATKKESIRKNKVEFGNLPSGLDNTPLAGEFTYNNGESMTRVTLRNGDKRYFFFFNDKLWKVYEEQKLTKKSKLGTNYESAVEKLTTMLGKKPRALEADPAQKRFFDQVDWADKNTILRVVDRGKGTIAILYVDRQIEENLEKYRANKGDGDSAVGADVAAVTRGKAEDKNKDVGAAYTRKK